MRSKKLDKGSRRWYAARLEGIVKNRGIKKQQKSKTKRKKHKAEHKKQHRK